MRASLIDKSYKLYDKISRYSQFPYYRNSITGEPENGLITWLDDTTPYIEHIVQISDNLDSISLQYYSSPLYYWVICSFNHIDDPFKPLRVGDKIKIPTFNSITFE